MAISDLPPPRPDLPTSEPSVAEEMTAIFGDQPRAPAPLPVALARARGRRPSRAALAIGLAAVTAGVGVWAGTSVSTTPTSAAAPPARRAAAPLARPSPAAEVAVAPAPPLPIAPGEITPPIADRVPAVTVTTRTQTISPAFPRPPLPADGAVIVRPAPAPPPVAVLRGDRCEDDGCIADRIDLADRSLADAYGAAAAAGVDARTLRGYRREWDRARGEADERPGETLRLYGMITSDLRGLARAATRDDEEPR